MSYNRIDLYGKGYFNIFMPTGKFRLDRLKGDTLAVRDFADVNTLPEFALCFSLKTISRIVFLRSNPHGFSSFFISKRKTHPLQK